MADPELAGEVPDLLSLNLDGSSVPAVTRDRGFAREIAVPADPRLQRFLCRMRAP